MRPVRMIRKRDGRLVEFDESRIADAIYKAALSVGGEDRFLAEELAGVVALFLDKTYLAGVANIEDVQDMVEKVLIETGHARTAKAFILYRERRTKIRQAERLPAGPAQRTLFDPPAVKVLDGARDEAYSGSAEAIARSLEAQADLADETSVEIAGRVEERIRKLGLEVISGSMLSALVDAELAGRGLVAALRERGAFALGEPRIDAALFPKEALRRGSPAERAGGGVLRQYALERIYGDEVADAHLTGRIFLFGLEDPTRLYSAAISPEGLRQRAVPGLTGRFRPEAVGSPRRFAAHLGRAVRRAAVHVTHGLSLSRVNLLMAPLLHGLTPAQLREEAWHLLTELAGIPGLEVELGLAPPAILARRRAIGPDGGALLESYAHYEETSLALAEAFLTVRGTGSGLGPRSELPRLTVTLGPGALEDAGACAVIAKAVREALDREPVLVILDREDMPLLGTAGVRVRLEDAARLTDPASLSVAVGARVAVNLAHAAFRAGPGNTVGFLGEVEAVAELALRGISARSRFLARSAAGPDGPLSVLCRPRGEGAVLLDIEGMTNSLSVAGLNEAVLHVTGMELHESDEALKLGQRVLAAIGHLCRLAPPEVAVDGERDPGVLSRFALRDRGHWGARREGLPEAYTPGAGLRRDAPVDLAMRLDMEGRLGVSLRTVTVEMMLDGAEHPSAETVIALLRKTWENTRVRQVLLGRGGVP